MFFTMTVLLFPPRAFCKSLVRTESLNGTLTFLPSVCSARACITLPRDERLWLMAAPSFRRSPVAPVESTRSLKNKPDLLFVIFTFLQCQSLHFRYTSDFKSISVQAFFLVYFCVIFSDFLVTLLFKHLHFLKLRFDYIVPQTITNIPCFLHRL